MFTFYLLQGLAHGFRIQILRDGQGRRNQAFHLMKILEVIVVPVYLVPKLVICPAMSTPVEVWRLSVFGTYQKIVIAVQYEKPSSYSTVNCSHLAS